MIVLDEHLPAELLGNAIRRWYRGRISVISELRPGRIIKDEAIPELLRTANEPRFVTLNWSDFWHQAIAHSGFCIVGFTPPSIRVQRLPSLLRRLFHLAEFRTDRSL